MMVSVGPFQAAAAHITPGAFPFEVTTFLSFPQNPVVWGSSSPDLHLCLILQMMWHSQKYIPSVRNWDRAMETHWKEVYEEGPEASSSRLCGCQPLQYRSVLLESVPKHL